MAKRKEVAPPPDPRKTDTLAVAKGVLEWPDEFTVKGEGRYTFHYGWKGVEATCWGPVGSKEQKWRTFPAHRITTIHRKTTARKATT